MSNEFTIRHIANAPRELVWQVFTQAEHLPKWFGPKGFTTPFSSLDLRVGGIYHYCMRSPDGFEIWGKWTFREVTPPSRLVWVNSFSDADQGLTRHPMNTEWPLEMLSSATFEEQEGQTLITISWLPLNASDAEIMVFAAGHDSMNNGWTGTFEQLDAYLATL